MIQKKYLLFFQPNNKQTITHSHNPPFPTIIIKMTVEAPIVQKTQRPERVDIGDGLVMRWSTIKDSHNIADCMAEAFKVPYQFFFVLGTTRHDLM